MLRLLGYTARVLSKRAVYLTAIVLLIDQRPWEVHITYCNN